MNENIDDQMNEEMKIKWGLNWFDILEAKYQWKVYRLKLKKKHYQLFYLHKIEELQAQLAKDRKGLKRSRSSKYLGVNSKLVNDEDLKYNLLKDSVIDSYKSELRDTKIKYMIQVWFSSCKIFKLHQEINRLQNEVGMRLIELEHYNQLDLKPAKKCIIHWGFGWRNFSELNVLRR